MALSGGFLAISGGGAGGGVAGRQKQRGTEGGRRGNGRGVNRRDALAEDHVGLLFSALWEPPQTGWEQENGF